MFVQKRRTFHIDEIDTSISSTCLRPAFTIVDPKSIKIRSLHHTVCFRDLQQSKLRIECWWNWHLDGILLRVYDCLHCHFVENFWSSCDNPFARHGLFLYILGIPSLLGGCFAQRFCHSRLSWYVRKLLSKILTNVSWKLT